MGVLEEAIREHLELKRRRGVDPAELQRVEREALGPVRRESWLYEDEDEDDLEYYDERPFEEGEGELHDEPDEDLVEPGDDPRPHGDPLADEAARLHPRPPGAPPLEPEDLLGQETVELSLERGPEGGQPRGRRRSDVLEQTPEFLHEAPDHDRLWFEQRPPRDFDFDG